MAISIYFGLPGAGKSTKLVQDAISGSKSKRYKYVYSNVEIKVPGVIWIDNDCIGRFDLRDCLILIDEGTLFANSRRWKQLSDEKIKYILEHRHFSADVCIYTQKWDGIDVLIRSVTDRVFYVYKGFFTRSFMSYCIRIPYGVQFPDPSSDKYGDIIMGYRAPGFFEKLFKTRLIRPLYYKYFDSFETYYLPPLPDTYKPYVPPDKPKKGSKNKKARPGRGNDSTAPGSASEEVA